MAGVKYAVTEDGTNIAYRVLDADPSCAEPLDVVLLAGGLIPLEIYEEEPGFARLLDGMRGLGRVIVLDRRGVGLSDPVVDWERPVLDQWADDLAAVVEAVDAHDAVIVALEGYGIGSRFVARHPERVERFVLLDPIVTPDDCWDEFRDGWFAQVRANMTGEIDLLAKLAPSREKDPAFREWYDRAGRLGASPATARRIWDSVMGSRPHEHLLDQITVPTLVVHRRDNEILPAGNIEHVAQQMPHATFIELEGGDLFAFAGDVDALVAEIAEFAVGERRVPPAQRLLSAVLFSDLVGSTERAASLGDADWKALLDRHDSIVRVAITRCGGSVIKTTGDGVLALFPTPSGALDATRRFRALLADNDLVVRVGIHVGEVDRRGDDVSGLAVNIAARVMSAAPNDGIAVTQSVTASMAGQATQFEPMGSHELKGIPGTWDLFRVVP